MNKAYGVVHGSYSDYSVDFICLTREVAEALVTKMNVSPTSSWREPYSVEEFDLAESADAVIHVSQWRARIDRETGEVHQYTTSPVWTHDTRTEEVDIGSTRYVFGASARSPEAALKIAQDKLAQLKAEEAGL